MTNPSHAGARREPLGAYLTRTGLVSPDDITSALEEQRHTGDRLGAILVGRGVLYEADLAKVMADLFGLPYRDLALSPADPGAATQIPEQFCRRRGVLPVEVARGGLTVAIEDPSDVQTRDDLRVVAQLPVHEVVVAAGQLRQAMAVAFEGATGRVEAVAAAGAAPPSPVPDADISDSRALPQNEAPVVRFVNQLLRRAVDERASDIHVEPTADGLRIRFRIDGLLSDATTVPPALSAGVVSRLKILTGMDIAERRRPQDGRSSVAAGGVSVDVRAVSLPTIDGEALVLRLLRQDPALLELGALGFLPESFGRYERSFRKARGLVLVTGPTGSGKSTTLYATVNALNTPTRNTVTVEDPIEYRVAGIKQTQVNPKVGYSFATGLRATLRSDPDTILIGEIRDLETARIAAESALTGHLVLSTLHANDAASSLTRLLDMGLEPYLVTSSLECVVAQRLLRRLCRRCRREHVPSSEERLELAAVCPGRPLPADVRLARAGGCAQCSHSGYRGRLAAHEVLVMDDDLRALVLGRAPAGAINDAAIRHGMQTLREDALCKLQAGDVSLEELKRVLA